MGSLTGKVALIFGGSGGIGFESAKCLAEAGATVIISSNREDRDAATVKKIEEFGGKAAYISGDYTDVAFIDAAFDFTVKTYGIPDITLNAAGMGSSGQTLGQTDYTTMDLMMKINVVSPYIVMQKAIELLQSAGKAGKIINVGSLRSHYTGREGNAPVYAASKAAIGWLTESTARTLHKPGNRIAVTLICPGAANTEMNLGEHGAPVSIFMHPSTVARCILAAATMPDEATIFDMTMLCTEQNPW